MGDWEYLDDGLDEVRHVAYGEEDSAEEQHRECDESSDRAGALRVFGQPCDDEAQGHERQCAENDEENQGCPGAGDVDAKDEIGNEDDKQRLRSVQHEPCCDLGCNERRCFEPCSLHSAKDSPLTPGSDLSRDSVHVVIHDHHGDDSRDKEIDISDIDGFDADFLNRHGRLISCQVLAVLIDDPVHDGEAELGGRQVFLIVIDRKGEFLSFTLHVIPVAFRDFDEKLDVPVFDGFFPSFGIVIVDQFNSVIFLK